MERKKANSEVTMHESESAVWQPTELNLFGHFPHLVEESKQLTQVVRRFDHERRNAIDVFNQFTRRLGSKREKISQQITELEEQLRLTLSSQGCGSIYLAFADELSSQGISEGEILEFFKLCLNINTTFCTEEIAKTAALGLENSYHRILIGQRSSQWVELIDKNARPMPSWFNGTSDQWRIFVYEHANFHYYLAPQEIKDRLGNGKSKLEFYEADYIWVTRPGGFPDWLVNTNGTPPSRATVEEEIEDDKYDVQEIGAQILQLTDQKHQMYLLSKSKHQKSIAFWERHRESLITKVASFEEMIAYFKLLDIHGFYSLTPDEILQAESESISQSLLVGQKAIDYVTGLYIDPEIIPHYPEIVALWLERKLREEKLVASMEESLSDELSEMLNLLCLESQRPDEKRRFLNDPTSPLWALRERNKKAYYFLRDHLAPLLGVSSGEHLLRLQETLQDKNKTSCVEIAVWRMAYVFSENYDAIAAQMGDERLVRRINDINKFAKNWLRRNWDWAYQLMEYTGTDEAKKIAEEQAGGVDIEVETDSQLAITAERKEIEEEMEEIERSVLADWSVLYACDGAVDGELVEITGETTDQKEAILTDLLLREKEGCVIKVSSVVHTLEWLVNCPQEIENLRPHKMVHREDFKQAKRGGERILYQLFPDDKKIVFFLLSKKGLLTFPASVRRQNGSKGIF